MDLERPPEFPGIKQLLEEMVDHRERIVRQVAGAPMAALAAMGKYQQVPIVIPSVETSPDRHFMRQWLDVAAAKSFDFKVFYEKLTPWGREDARHEMEREDAERKLARIEQQQFFAQRDAVADAFKWGGNDEKTLSAIDKKLVSTMVDRDYFDASPRMYTADIGGFHGGPWAMPLHGSIGSVFMHSDKLGDYDSSLPASDSDKLQIANDWSEGNVPKDHAKQTYLRWFVLFHEVSHCQYAVPAAPFTPSPGTLNSATVEAMNRWVLGGLSVFGSQTMMMLSENHSDVYAAMLLMEATGHAPLARTVIEEFSEKRRIARLKSDELIVKDAKAGKLEPGFFPDNHCTQFALERAMENIDQWRGKSPSELKRMAHEFSSDGFLDLINPKRMTENNEPVGRYMMENILPQAINSKMLSSNLAWLSISYERGGDPNQWIQGQDATSPVYPLFKRSWDKIQPLLASKFSEIIDKDYKTGKEMTMSEGLRGASLHLAIFHLNRFVSSIDMPIFDEKDEMFVTAQAAALESVGIIKSGLLSLNEPSPLNQSPLPHRNEGNGFQLKNLVMNVDQFLSNQRCSPPQPDIVATSSKIISSGYRHK